MSSTNKTTYYNLPQFVDSDLFNPLVDDNDAYDKIDTALHNIADAEGDNASDIVGVKSRVTTAEGKIEALETQNGNEVLSTTAQTLSGAINELDTDTASLDGRVDIVEDDINNVNTGLKVKVATIENQNGTEVLTTVAQTLSGAVNELKSGEDSLDGRLDVVENDINNNSNGILARLTALENSPAILNRKFILIGDSFACGIRGGGQSWVTGWANFFKNLFGNRVFWYDPSSDTPFEGTSGFNTNSDKNFIGQLNYVYSNKLGATNPEEITDIVVIGGTNDVANVNGLDAAIDNFFTRARTIFPNADIKVGCFGLNIRAMVNNSEVYNIYRTRVTSNGGDFLEDILRLGCSQAWDSGAGHLTEDGYNKCNPLIAECIISGHTTYEFFDSIEVTSTANISYSGTFTWGLVITRTENAIYLRFIDTFRNNGWKIHVEATYSGSGSLVVDAFENNTAVIYQPFVNEIIFDTNFVLIDPNNDGNYIIYTLGMVIAKLDTSNHLTIRFATGAPWASLTGKNLYFAWTGRSKEVGLSISY